MAKVTIRDFLKRKGKGKLTMLTVYDYSMARILAKSKLDGILVGDSLGMTMLGYPSTLPVTMRDVVHHLKAVVNAKPEQLIVADMPFLSYEHSVKEAVKNAGRLARIGADAVKLEGGREISKTVRRIVEAGIPVMGHIGLTPQRYLRIGGYRVIKDRERLLEDAKALEEAGVFSIVLENVYSDIAEEITKAVSVPTICIGAGPHCDGQVLVIHDLLGLSEFTPYFARRYLNLSEEILKAVNAYVDDVNLGRFPGKENYKSSES
ncbi:MAG: 3-methyl-2-oxobutanoate hydroxymethyltransferase [Candidatus Aramenus sp.]|nr:3-methyl-2-oxobutanoate hydroxymethyltransferase [Candidatus Aramenus sp.]